MKNRFVEPEVDRLPLSDGDWIEVKRRLNVGERKQLESTGVKRTLFSPPEIDWVEYNIGRSLVWVTDWSFKGADDKPVKLTRDAVSALDPDTFDEIQEALSKHIEAQDAIKKAGTTLTTS